MPLWLAALLFIIFAGGFTALLFLSRRKKNKAWLIAGTYVFGTALLAFIVYLACAFVLLEAIK